MTTFGVMLTRDDVLAFDEQDPLALHRDRFEIPDGLIYLDGNSLGAQQRHIPDAARVVVNEWREQLIGGWRDAGWWELPMAVGAKIASIIGAEPDHVLVCDTTTANLYKTLHAALALHPDRAVILVEESGFPTDNYIASSVAERSGKDLRVIPRGAVVADRLDTSVAVALLNHVNFRTAEVLDMPSATSAVHEVGALTVWDLSHSAGVIPIDLKESGVDFAVGCTYKYLNGGPGAPAYLYVSPRHLGASTQPLQGWLGHAEPFEMSNEYEPAPTVRRFLTGTQPIVSMRLLDAALDVYADVDVSAIRAKSMRLTDLFIQLVDDRCEGLGLEVISPLDSQHRGSQVSLSHPNAVPIYEGLVAAGVRGDFRTPDILRFGFAPLYVSYANVWDAVEVLREVLTA